MFGLLQWHIWHAPKWLVVLTWNLERAVARYFSAATMARTLVSHWHKDAVSYQQGTLSKIALAFAWNMISRGIGFVVRTIVLALYGIVAIAVAVIGILSVIIFWLWPLLAASAIVLGLGLLI